MDGVLQRILTIMVSVECIIGNLGNGFIAVVNFMDWAKRRKMSSVNQILTALAIFRIGFLLFLFLEWWVCVLYPDLLGSAVMSQVTFITWMVTSHFSIWLATCLSIFYFLKIANFSNSTFLYLKGRVKKVVSVTLLGSLVLLFLDILVIEIYHKEWMAVYATNMSYSSSSRNSTQFPILLLSTETVLMLIPFTVSLTSFLLLIFSLGKHLKRMQLNGQGSRDANTTAHVKALRTMIASLLLYITFFLSLVVHIYYPELPKPNLTVSFFRLSILIAFPLCHSFILILETYNLRQASIAFLMWLRCCSRVMESLDP